MAAVFMAETHIASFHDSFRRCSGQGGRFFDVVHDHYLKSSAEVRARFQGTDFTTQKARSRLSFHLRRLIGDLTRREQVVVALDIRKKKRS